MNSKTISLATNPIQSDISKKFSSIKLINEFEEFMQFCSTPRSMRKIKTQKDFAQKFGLSEDTLTNWKKMPGFFEAIQWRVIDREQDHLTEIIETLRMKAESGNVAAIKFYLQHIGAVGKNKK